MILFPNPKINIGLNIVEKRPDGYHNIDTVFYPVTTLTDILEIVPAKSDRTTLKVTGGQIACSSEDNLVIKAFHMLNDIHSLPPVDIYLHKRIPDGAGLGGGSADAAFTLKAINEMFSLGYDDKLLAAFAARLGADCAFFIYNRPMHATGIGTELSPIDIDLSQYEIRIEKPSVNVSTKEAYSCVTPSRPRQSLLSILENHPTVEKWKNLIVNDFEKSVFLKYPQIMAIKRQFYSEGALYASMSGSGSAVYGIFRK